VGIHALSLAFLLRIPDPGKTAKARHTTFSKPVPYATMNISPTRPPPNILPFSKADHHHSIESQAGHAISPQKNKLGSADRAPHGADPTAPGH